MFTRVNINILGISELKWTGMEKFNSDGHYIYCGQKSLKWNGVSLTTKKIVWNAVSSVQVLSQARIFVTPWTVACQASLAITNSRNLAKLMSIESVMPSNHLILCSPLLLLLSIFPRIREIILPLSQFILSSGRNIGVSALASVLPMNIQDWFLLGLTILISLQSKGLLRIFSNTTVQKHQFFIVQLSSQSNSHIHIWLLEKP